MENVEILNVIPAHDQLTVVNIVGIVLLSLGIVAIIVSILLDIHENASGMIFGVTLAIAVFPIIMGAVFCFNTDHCPTQYEVVLKEEAAFDDIVAKYDIIEQRGKIYVIREKQ